MIGPYGFIRAVTIGLAVVWSTATLVRLVRFAGLWQSRLVRVGASPRWLRRQLAIATLRTTVLDPLNLLLMLVLLNLWIFGGAVRYGWLPEVIPHVEEKTLTIVTPEQAFELVSQGDAEALRAHLAASPEHATSTNADGLTLLFWAAYHRRPELVEAVLAHDPPLGILELAALGRVEELQGALRLDGEVARRSPDGFTPLHYAAFFAHPAAVEALLSAGADVHAVADNPSRVTALHSAVAAQSPEAVRLLLAAGAEVDARQAGGYTALHAAAKAGQEELVQLLLEAGADRGLPAGDERTAAQLAREAGHEELAATLEP